MFYDTDYAKTLIIEDYGNKIDMYRRTFDEVPGLTPALILQCQYDVCMWLDGHRQTPRSKSTYAPELIVVNATIPVLRHHSDDWAVHGMNTLGLIADLRKRFPLAMIIGESSMPEYRADMEKVGCDVTMEYGRVLLNLIYEMLVSQKAKSS